MQVTKRQARTLRQAIHHWREGALLTDTQAEALSNSLHVVGFDWKRLAKYSFWFALFCILSSVSAVLSDSVLMQKLAELFSILFNTTHVTKCAMLSALAAAFIYYGVRRRARHPERIFSTEAVFCLGVFAIAGAVYQLGAALDDGSGDVSSLMLIACGIYAALGYFLRSNLIWVFALVSLGGWMGTKTGYVSGWGAYYLGMNFPLRFVLFGGVLTALALAMPRLHRMAFLARSTQAMGLLYLFVALWILSIFGNYGDMEDWYRAKQIELFHWSLLFALAAGGAIYHGLRMDDGMSKGFGITFMLINLYTRYFEYFWNSTHKAIFFALLGLSFWWLGRRAEYLWQGKWASGPTLDDNAPTPPPQNPK